MPIQHKVNNVWKNTNKYIKQNGVWKEVFNDYHKVNNVWYPVWKYNYEVGSWGTCSTTCGGGTQSRSVRCKRNDGIYKSDTFCTKSGIGKPITSQVCNTQSCVAYMAVTASADDGAYFVGQLDASLQLVYSYGDIPISGFNSFGYTYLPYNPAYVYNGNIYLYIRIFDNGGQPTGIAIRNAQSVCGWPIHNPYGLTNGRFSSSWAYSPCWYGTRNYGWQTIYAWMALPVSV